MKKDDGRRKVIILFTIAILVTVIAQFTPEEFLLGIPVILLSLLMITFSSLSFAFSIQRITKKDLSFGIPILVISAIIMLLWITGFIIGIARF